MRSVPGVSTISVARIVFVFSDEPNLKHKYEVKDRFCSATEASREGARQSSRYLRVGVLSHDLANLSFKRTRLRRSA